MKRLIPILILLLAALAINVVVAVVCATLPTAVEFDIRRTASLRKQHWNALEASGKSESDPMRFSGVYQSFGREVRIIRPDIDEPATTLEHYSGWPLRILSGVERVVTLAPDDQEQPKETRERQYTLLLNDKLIVHALKPGNTPGGKQSVFMQPIQLTPHPSQVLPLRPLVGGIIINTLFYVLLIIAGPVLWMLAKGTYFRLRGRCPRCGYDLSHAPPDRTACPECGTRLKPDPVK